MTIGIDARMYRSSVAGIGRYSQNLIKNLLEIDSENEYILFVTSEDREEAAQQLPQTDNYRFILTETPHYSFSEQTKFLSTIKREKLDLMFFLNTNYPVRYRGKFIVTIHDLTLYLFPMTARKNGYVRRKAFNYVLKTAVRKSARIITDSKNTKNDILETYHPNPDKISVIPLAADDKKLAEPSKSTLERVKNEYKLSWPLILSVGQFRAHKNIPNLIRAFNIVRRKIMAQLVLIGKPDPAYHELNEALDKSPYKSDIIRPGFVSNEELAAWYKLSTCYVFPSLYEGFGLPALEAMQAGLPVVSSNRSSLPEVCEDAALYFDPSNPDDMADKIKVILEDKKLRQSFAAHGRVIVKKYSWAKTARETLKIINEVGNK